MWRWSVTEVLLYIIIVTVMMPPQFTALMLISLCLDTRKQRCPVSRHTEEGRLPLSPILNHRLAPVALRSTLADYFVMTHC